MDKKNELPPTCELAYLLTCLLAYLPICSLYLLCFFTPIPSRPHRILVPSGDTKGGAVFLIRSSRPPALSAKAVFPTPCAVFPSSFSPPFRRAVPSLISSGVSPDVIPSVVLFITGSMGTRYGSMGHGFLFNAIFCHLTLRMLNTKKQC